jgi:hypothetical protein
MFSCSTTFVLLFTLLFLSFTAVRGDGVVQHDRIIVGSDLPNDTICAQSLNHIIDDLVVACTSVRDAQTISLFSSALKRVSTINQRYRLVCSSIDCVEYNLANHTDFMTLKREWNHISDYCTFETAKGTVRTSLGVEFQFVLESFGKQISLFLSVLRLLDDLLGYVVANFLKFYGSLSLHDCLALLIGVFNPWFPIAYLLCKNWLVAFIAPLLIMSGFSVRWLSLFVLLDILIPGTIFLFFLLLVPFAIIRYRNRRHLESLSEVGYTFLYFLAFGLYVEIAFRLYDRYPWVIFSGFAFFFLFAIVRTWARKYLEVEYTITSVQNGAPGVKSRPHKVYIETEFPFTLMQPLNRFRLWMVGLEWSLFSRALQGYFGDLPGQAVVAGPVVGGVVMPTPEAPVPFSPKVRAMLQPKPKKSVAFHASHCDPPASSSSNIVVGVPVDVMNIDPTVFESLKDVTWEAKGKTKSGRGIVKLVKTPGNRPLQFKRVKSAFWMSDPDLDVEEIRAFSGDSYHHFAHEDWDLAAGYLEIVMADGSVQHVYYDPDVPDDFEEELFANMEGSSTVAVKVGDVISPATRVVLVKKPLKTANDIALEKLTAQVAQLTALLSKTVESNGTISKLPAVPASSFQSPLSAFAPHGCFHHKCRLSSSTTPCNTVCNGPSCVHSTVCSPAASKEGMGDSMAYLLDPDSTYVPVSDDGISRCSNGHALSKNAVKKKVCNVCKEPVPSVRVLDSSVPANPLLEYSDAILASVVVVQSSSATGYGVYTDRGIITQKHIVGSGDFSVAPWYSPGTLTQFKASALLLFPKSVELVLVPGKILNATPLAMASFVPLKAHLGTSSSIRGAIAYPGGSAVGSVSYKPNLEEELLINVGTKAGMCGCPYVVKGQIVGFHAFGNNNRSNNGGLAITPALREWLVGQRKN